MNDGISKNGMEPDDDKKKVSFNRVAIWVVVAAIGLYLVGSGLWGMLGG